VAFWPLQSHPISVFTRVQAISYQQLPILLDVVKMQSSPPSANPSSQAVSMERLSASTNSFTLDLYKKLDVTSKGQNIFFAPWSIATALAMVYLGAKGDTATQMAKVSSELSIVSLKAGSHVTCIIHLPMWNKKEQHERTVIRHHVGCKKKHCMQSCRTLLFQFISKSPLLCYYLYL